MEINPNVSKYILLTNILSNIALASTDVARCQPRSSINLTDSMDIESIENYDSEDMNVGDSSINDYEVNWMSPSIIKPLFTMSSWRHPRTRDRRLAIFIVLPIIVLYR